MKKNEKLVKIAFIFMFLVSIPSTALSVSLQRVDGQLTHSHGNPDNHQ
jgi:hypothetical protein